VNPWIFLLMNIITEIDERAPRRRHESITYIFQTSWLQNSPIPASIFMTKTPFFCHVDHAASVGRAGLRNPAAADPPLAPMAGPVASARSASAFRAGRRSVRFAEAMVLVCCPVGLRSHVRRFP
jgi:hypothetical protein